MSLPDGLCCQALLALAQNFRGILQLVLLELGFFCLHPKDNALSIDETKKVFDCQAVSLLTTVSLNQLVSLLAFNLYHAHCHLIEAKNYILECHPIFQDMFGPHQYNWLVDWVSVGVLIKDRGGQLPVNNTEKHPDNDRLWLTDRAIAILRDISYSFNFPASRLGSLVNKMAIFFLGRPLQDHEWPCFTTLIHRFERLGILDHGWAAQKFEAWLAKSSEELGFKIMFYSTSDDSTHRGNVN